MCSGVPSKQTDLFGLLPCALQLILGLLILLGCSSLLECLWTRRVTIGQRPGWAMDVFSMEYQNHKAGLGFPQLKTVDPNQSEAESSRSRKKPKKWNCYGSDLANTPCVHPAHIKHGMMAFGHLLQADHSMFRCLLVIQLTLGWYVAMLLHACGSDVVNRSGLPKCHHSMGYVGWMRASGTILHSGKAMGSIIMLFSYST